jgi:hypothetical protein
MPYGLDARSTFFFCLGLGLALILLAGAMKLKLRRTHGTRRTPDPIPLDKLVVLLGPGEKIIESGIAGVFISLEKFFRDTGFSVIVTPSLSRFDSILQSGAPVIIGIDCRMGAKAIRKIDAMCRACFGMRASVVFFYNAVRPDKLSPPPSLPQATYLGESFGSIHVLELISYAISVETNSPRPRPAGDPAIPGSGAANRHAQRRGWKARRHHQFRTGHDLFRPDAPERRLGSGDGNPRGDGRNLPLFRKQKGHEIQLPAFRPGSAHAMGLPRG